MEYRLYNEQVAAEIAADLLKVGAVKLKVENPFTWASGWKSPIYCDNRVTLSFPELRSRICSYFCEIIQSTCPDADAIAGVATAGIPQGALIADKLGLPFLYVRSKPKGHGMENLIEGRLVPGSKVVVIEDLISTGGSSLKAIEGIRNGGGVVLKLLSIFNYGFPHAQENFAADQVPVNYLSDYPSLISQALASGIISENDVANLGEWRKDPAVWGK